MGKPSKKRKQSDDEQVDDVRAWGKSKQNYYQQQEQEYSEASEEQQQAKQIYQHQLNELNREDYYQLPDQDAGQSEEEEEDQGEINDQYICKEILWATELAKMFEGVKDDKYELRKKIYDSYLLILLTLKQFKIPYMDQHPLISNLPVLKKALSHFQKQLPSLYEKNHNHDMLNGTEEGIQSEEADFENHQQYQNQEDEELPSDEPNQVIEKNHNNSKKNEGLSIYQKIKQQKEEQRRAKKAENKKIREANRPKQAFRLVGQNEGRLANEKILKNKGLMKRRRRDDGNSRTKLRHKYQKALVRRRAKGPLGVKQNPGRFYEGEDKVLYGKIASTKLN